MTDAQPPRPASTTATHREMNDFDPSAPYRPISCAAHDLLLEAATLRRPVTLDVREEGAPRTTLRGVIEDVYSRDGAEYLRIRSGPILRLDRLVSIDGEPVPPA